MAQPMLRLFATPETSAVLPSSIPAISHSPGKQCCIVEPLIPAYCNMSPNRTSSGCAQGLFLAAPSALRAGRTALQGAGPLLGRIAPCQRARDAIDRAAGQDA